MKKQDSHNKNTMPKKSKPLTLEQQLIHDTEKKIRKIIKSHPELMKQIKKNFQDSLVMGSPPTHQEILEEWKKKNEYDKNIMK